MDFIKIIVPLFAGLLIFFIVGWFTGSKEFGGVETKDDERLQFIKHKAIAHSWVFMFVLFILNAVNDFLNVNKETLKKKVFFYEYPSFVYLIILIGSYFVFYFIYHRRFSSHEE